MSYLKYASSLAAFLFMSTVVHADNITYTAPFNDVRVAYGSKIYVTYDFAPHKQVLHCNTDSKSITMVQYEYKDSIFRQELPITLKDDAIFKGKWADPSGTLIIYNDWGSSKHNDESMLVSCEYRSAVQ